MKDFLVETLVENFSLTTWNTPDSKKGNNLKDENSNTNIKVELLDLGEEERVSHHDTNPCPMSIIPAPSTPANIHSTSGSAHKNGPISKPEIFPPQKTQTQALTTSVELPRDSVSDFPVYETERDNPGAYFNTSRPRGNIGPQNFLLCFKVVIGLQEMAVTDFVP